MNYHHLTIEERCCLREYYDVFFCDDCMELDSVVEELEDAGAL